MKEKDYRDLPTATITALEVFKVGEWNGDKYSLEDLKGIVDAFPKVKFRPTVKAGHADGQDKEDAARKVFGAPALGYVTKLYVADDTLYADLGEVPRKFADLIRAGAYRRVSAEIYWQYDDNGDKFPRVLKSIAFLGADIPAITSLKEVENLYHVEGMPAHAYVENDREFRIYSCDAKPILSAGSRGEANKHYKAEEAIYMDEKNNARGRGRQGYNPPGWPPGAEKNYADIEEREDGFYATVDGKEYGPFKTKEAAQAKCDEMAGGAKEKPKFPFEREEHIMDEKLKEFEAKLRREFEQKLEAAKKDAQAEAQKEFERKQAAIEAEATANAKGEAEAEKKALSDRIEKLESQRRSEKRDAWIGSQKKAGHIAPKEEPRVRALMDEMSETKTVKFSQDGKEMESSTLKMFQDFIEQRPSLFKELSQEGEHADEGEPNPNPQLEMDRLAQGKVAQYAKDGRKIQLRDAYKEVWNERPDLFEAWKRGSNAQ